MSIPSAISRENVLSAIEFIKENGVPVQREAAKYALEYEGEYYPPKYVISIAHKFYAGQELPSFQFSGGDEANGFLTKNGFTIVYKPDAAWSIRPLVLYADYSREDVHLIFDPYGRFVPQAGTWGLQGIVRIPMMPKDYVFFVTFGSQQADHIFDEKVTDNGILTWQSQPKQTLTDITILDFINHDHTINNIYLFLRTSKNAKYTYLGRLAYLEHDPAKERPVYFRWQILDWELPNEKAQQMGLILDTGLSEENDADSTERDQLTLTDPPNPLATSRATPRQFLGRHIDFTENDSKNKKLGKAGELLVLDYERNYLIAKGHPDLAEKIIHTSEIKGDGTGYDIQSFTLEGEPKFIEVKTTSGYIGTPFIISKNELAFSNQQANSYYLYRVYNYNRKINTGQFYILPGDISKEFNLEPLQFKARIKIES